MLKENKEKNKKDFRPFMYFYTWNEKQKFYKQQKTAVNSWRYSLYLVMIRIRNFNQEHSERSVCPSVFDYHQIKTQVKMILGTRHS